MRREPCKGCTFSTCHGAELGQDGQEFGRHRRAETVHGRADGCPMLEGAAVGDQLADIGIDNLDLALDDVDHGLEESAEAVTARCLGAVLLRDLHGDELLAAADQGAQAGLVGIRSLPKVLLCPALTAVGPKHVGINGVALAVRAEGTDKALDLECIGTTAGDAGANNWKPSHSLRRVNASHKSCCVNPQFNKCNK